MSGRPEGDDGGYGWIEPHDADAWKEFTPWRPGDQSTSDETAKASVTRDHDDGRRWWTEPQPEPFDVGDRVGSTRSVGGIFGGAVPAGSLGEIVSTRLGLFDEFVTVQFENGMTEEVKPDVLKYESWF